MKRKYVLELDDKPALVFVQEQAGKYFKVYQDGAEVKGIRTIKITANFDDHTTHEIEYLTGRTKN